MKYTAWERRALGIDPPLQPKVVAPPVPKEPRPTRADRFWARVDPDLLPGDCERWTGPSGPSGTGVTEFYGTRVKPYVLAWMLYHVAVVPPGFRVKQTCNRKLCCHPEHLVLVERTRHQRSGREPRDVPVTLDSVLAGVYGAPTSTTTER